MVEHEGGFNFEGDGGKVKLATRLLKTGLISVSVPIHSPETRYGVPTSATIGIVDRVVGDTEVGTDVIQWIAIDVIDLFIADTAGVEGQTQQLSSEVNRYLLTIDQLGSSSSVRTTILAPKSVPTELLEPSVVDFSDNGVGDDGET